MFLATDSENSSVVNVGSTFRIKFLRTPSASGFGSVDACAFVALLRGVSTLPRFEKQVSPAKKEQELPNENV